jgi:hypothetical protein
MGLSGQLARIISATFHEFATVTSKPRAHSPAGLFTLGGATIS